MLVYLIQFFAFSFFGWIIDSTYSSITKKRIVFSGYFKGVPLCPLYGFGGIVLLDGFELLAGNPAWVVIGVTTVLVILVEYVGGYFSEMILGEKLWDYSAEYGNLYGYISLFHSTLWLLLVGVLYFSSGQRLIDVEQYIRSTISSSREIDVLLFLASVSLGFALAMANKRHRLRKKIHLYQ
jgi:uncharacterized membrane protein